MRSVVALAQAGAGEVHVILQFAALPDIYTITLGVVMELLMNNIFRACVSQFEHLINLPSLKSI